MLSFFEPFSKSLTLALFLWVPMACLLIFPLFVWLYVNQKKIDTRFMLVMFLVALYALGLLAFTLYPLPDDAVAYCRTHAVGSQLVLFHWMSDVVHYGRNAILQVLMNLLFFVPVGVFARNVFRWSLARTALVAFVLSGTVELLQLSALGGLYPCSYRLFDVDDLMINTFGGLVGYMVARFLPMLPLLRPEMRDQKQTPTFDQYTIALYADSLVVVLFATLMTLPLGEGAAVTPLAIAAKVVLSIALGLVVPYYHAGKSFGWGITRGTLAASPRTHRKEFFKAYGIYTAFMLIIVLVGNMWALMAICSGYAAYYSTKKLPHEL